MSGEPPRLTERAQAALDARRAREAAALRDNLRRRKQQARTPDAGGERDPLPEGQGSVTRGGRS